MSHQIFGADIFVCFGLNDAQTFHEPTILLWSKLLYFFTGTRPLVSSVLQTLVQQNKSISIPEQGLEPVAPFAAEQKDRLLTRIQLELLPYLRCQPVDSAARICVSAGNIYRFDLTQIQVFISAAPEPDEAALRPLRSGFLCSTRLCAE